MVKTRAISVFDRNGLLGAEHRENSAYKGERHEDRNERATKNRTTYGAKGQQCSWNLALCAHGDCTEYDREELECQPI